MRDIEVWIKEIQNEIESNTFELETLPSGNLLEKKNFFYHLVNGRQVGITKKLPLIRQLCRKRLLESRQKSLKDILPLLKNIVDKPHLPSCPAIIKSLPKAYQKTPITHFYHPRAVEWMKEDYERCTYRTDQLKYTTKSGIKMRSKSEMIIGNLLEEIGLIYRYEAKVIINGRVMYPDFTIMNPFTSKIVYLEHFGAFHLAGYLERFLEKIQLHLEVGLIPFRTMIYTFERDIQTPQRLKELIYRFIF